MHLNLVDLFPDFILPLSYSNSSPQGSEETDQLHDITRKYSWKVFVQKVRNGKGEPGNDLKPFTGLDVVHTNGY